MSDLESTAARRATAQPITAIATGKLRGFSRSDASVRPVDGLVDAFSEVFARMAPSSSAPLESEPIAVDQSSRAERDEPPESVVAETAKDSEVEQDESVAELVSIVVAAAIDASNQNTSQPAEQPEAVQTDSEQPEAEHVLAAQRTGDDSADTLTPQTEVVDDDSATAEELKQLPLTNSPDAGNSHRRQQSSGDAMADEPVETMLVADQAQDSPEETTVSNPQPIEQTPRSALESSDEGNGSTSSRRDRRRDRKGNESPDSLASPGQRSRMNSAGQQGGPTAAQSVAAEAAIQNQVTADTAQPPVDHSVQAVQGVAAMTTNSQNTGVRSARQAMVGPSSSTGGSSAIPRGSAMPLESAPGSRADAAAEPKADGGKSKSTADTISRIKLIQRVSKAFQHLGPEGGVVRLRLAPAELGSVRVEMRIQEKKVQARVVADTEAASAALREHLPELRARLESYGMQVEKIEVEIDLSDRGQDSSFDNPSEHHQPWNREDRRPSGHPRRQSDRSVSPAVSQVAPMHSQSLTALARGVDVRL